MDNDAQLSAMDWEESLRENTKQLEIAPEIADLWVQRAVLLMLDDHPDLQSFSVLDEVEKCILEALRLDPQHLDALEEAAHFYDVMAPDRTKATMFAQSYIEVAQKEIADMQMIIDKAD
jgi:bacterioferritin (cytochrome b1)